MVRHSQQLGSVHQALLVVARQLLDPFERVAVEPIRVAQPLREPSQPLRTILVGNDELLGDRGGAVVGRLHAPSVPG